MLRLLLGVFLTGAVVAQAPAPPQPPSSTASGPATPAPPVARPIGTMSELMVDIVYPTSDAIQIGRAHV